MSKIGRPSEYDAQVAQEICMRLANGESLNSICKSEGMPSKSTVCLWVLEDREGFSDQYDKSRKLQAQLLADEIIDISDDSTNDYMVRQSKSGEEYETVNPEVIGRSRLRVDTRKWYLSKVLPKVYGDRTVIDATINDYTNMTPEDRKRRVMELQQAIQNAERG